MNQVNLSQLILYVVDQANDRDDTVTTIRLVKFLYLIDLEYYRIKRKTLTGFNWIFHLHGPYAFEFIQIGEKIGYSLGREEFESGSKKGVIFTVDQPVLKPVWLGYTEESIIDRILEVWAGVDTKIMLDYVYNRTEPMMNAVRGQRLDFSKVVAGSRYYEMNVNIDKKKGDLLLKALHEGWNRNETNLIPIETNADQYYAETAKGIDQDDYDYGFTESFSGLETNEDVILGDI
jgi:hypothetical protein